ncbi:MAG: BON domain-containing protein, partial [Ktedonobacterales bacterium]
GPPRYFFLRRERGAREEVAHWPPEVKPLEAPENIVCVGVRLHAEDGAWRADPVAQEADLTADAGGAFVLTRQTMLGLRPDGVHESNVTLALLGVRVINEDGKGAEYASHLVLRVNGGMGFGPHQPLVVPIDSLLLGAYIERNSEHGLQAHAELDLHLAPAQVASMPPYLPDAIISRNVVRALDVSILSPQARHAITFETEAGRVSLYGRAEISTFGDEARAELEHTPGVVDISDHILYGELLQQQVVEALADRGYIDVDVLYEHGLVNLRGTVPDHTSFHKAEDIALRIPGVRGVVNDLTVASPVNAEA